MKIINRYRQIVFLLITSYWIYKFTEFNLDSFGWHFRYLTIWAMLGCWMAALWMIHPSSSKHHEQHQTGISIITVLNIMMLILYWTLYSIDPSLIHEESPGPWWTQYYQHLLAPLLQIIDAFFILGVFRQFKSCLYGILTIIFVYILWIELLVAPRNDTPKGFISSGFPYPFLNDMIVIDRIMFYSKTVLTATLITVICWSIVKLIHIIQQHIRT